MGLTSGDGYYQEVDEARWDGESSLEKDLQFQDDLNKMHHRFYEAARAEVGATIECACCARKVVKKSYQQRFCPAVLKGKRKTYPCKDRYHNLTNPRGKFAHLA